MRKIKVDLQKIKELRQQKGLSKVYMAKALDYQTPTGYHYLESGRCQISAEHFFTIVEILEVPVIDLVTTSTF